MSASIAVRLGRTRDIHCLKLQNEKFLADAVACCIHAFKAAVFSMLLHTATGRLLVAERTVYFRFMWSTTCYYKIISHLYFLGVVNCWGDMHCGNEEKVFFVLHRKITKN